MTQTTQDITRVRVTFNLGAEHAAEHERIEAVRTVLCAHGIVMTDQPNGFHFDLDSPLKNHEIEGGLQAIFPDATRQTVTAVRELTLDSNKRPARHFVVDGRTRQP